MKKVFLILGKSGSGKDTLVRNIVERGEIGVQRLVRDTSRPQRTSEKDGVDYNFKTASEMRNSMSSYIEWDCFNDWFYATNKDAIPEGVSIMTGSISTYESLVKTTQDFELYTIYLNIDKETQRERLLLRGDSQEEVARRIKADDKDFTHIYDILSAPENPNVMALDGTLTENSVFLLSLAFIGGKV